MSTNEILGTVVGLVRRTIAESSGREVVVEADTELIAAGHLDSLTVLQLFVALQDELGVELGVDDLTEEGFGSPRAIAALVETRQ